MTRSYFLVLEGNNTKNEIIISSVENFMVENKHNRTGFWVENGGFLKVFIRYDEGNLTYTNIGGMLRVVILETCNS